MKGFNIVLKFELNENILKIRINKNMVGFKKIEEVCKVIDKFMDGDKWKYIVGLNYINIEVSFKCLDISIGEIGILVIDIENILY